MSARGFGLGLSLGLGLGLALGLAGCRGEPEPTPDAKPSVPAPAPTPASASGPVLDGALLIGRFDTSAAARLLAQLPAPSPTGSPLVDVFAAIVTELHGDGSLAAVGLRADAEITLSLRALDGRAASTRKLLGELVAEQVAGGAAPDSALVARLQAEAGTLGLHLRAELPVTDEARLRAALARVAGDEPSWADACAPLEAAGASLCRGRERVLAWVRPAVDGRVRVDAVYWFAASSDAEQLAWILARADGWASAPADADPPATDGLALELRSPGVATLLQAEALADAVANFAAGTLDYHAYLDRERAFQDLVPTARVFDGITIAIEVGERGFTAQTRWSPHTAAPIALAELFAPIPEPLSLPSVADTCADTDACVRVRGLTLTPRFAPLAVGPFADTTGVTRVLRHAGDRGPILLGLSSWPNLLGTAGRLASPERAEAGLMSEAQAALLEHSHALGGAAVELGPTSADDRFAAYLRVGAEAYAAVRPLAGVAGLSPRPIALAGVSGTVDRGAYEGTPVYFVDERDRGGSEGEGGGWFLLADADERARWLLTRPRERPEPDAALLRVRVGAGALAELAVREQVDHTDDPAVRAWLEPLALTIELRLTPTGPVVVTTLAPIPAP